MLDVLIAGAGPTGLVLALWLTRFGVRVRIIDKTKEPGTTSRALGVHARTLEFYRQAGCADSVVEAGIPAEGVNLWVRGAKTARLPFRRIGEGLSPYPYMLIFPQDDHERLLIAQLNHLGVHVERETELIRFDLRNDSVRIVLKRRGASEEVVCLFLETGNEKGRAHEGRSLSRPAGWLCGTRGPGGKPRKAAVKRLPTCWTMM